MKKENRMIKLGNIYNKNGQAGQLYDSRYLGQTLCACTHGYAIGYIFVKDSKYEKRK